MAVSFSAAIPEPGAALPLSACHLVGNRCPSFGSLLLALRGGEIEPGVGLDIVLRHTPAVPLHEAEVGLSLAAHETFRDHYAHAREAQSDTLFNEILDIFDDASVVRETLATDTWGAPLMSIPLSEWIRLLRQRGPLWVVYGWRRLKTDGSLERSGRHAVIVYSMTGDGSPSGTVVHYINPSGARRQQRSFDAFVRIYEIGYEIGSGEQEGFTQLVHY